MARILHFKILNHFPQLSHCFTTRQYERDITTTQGQEYFLKSYQSEQTNFILPKQVNGFGIQVIKDKSSFLNNRQFVADAIITNQKNIWIGILVADCFPILIFEPSINVIAVIHAGWKGIDQNIHLKTLQHILGFINCSIKNLLIGIGPGIGSCCFEVGKEVSDKFEKRSIISTQFVHPVSKQKALVDLRGLIVSDFVLAGVSPENIENMNYCTSCCSDLFYSYRKEGKNTGRMLLAARLNETSQNDKKFE
ncbi:MAG: peptidoglycan editing factor PgeF [Candidatus Atribacteria bacterium]|nr:peptidoglycan editing factor PgeF [Candidatus Atribacteria bacterium]